MEVFGRLLCKNLEKALSGDEPQENEWLYKKAMSFIGSATGGSKWLLKSPKHISFTCSVNSGISLIIR